MIPCGFRAPVLRGPAEKAARPGPGVTEPCNGRRFTSEHQVNTDSTPEQPQLGTPNNRANPAQPRSIQPNPCGFRAVGHAQGSARRLPSLALSRVLLVLASVVLFSYAYYASTPPDVDPDTGSVLVVLAACAVWLAPYLWWCRCVARRERIIADYLTEPTEVPKGVT